ncbi:hypothetical protein FSARC_7383 [Fusarium sarcochroum]|uniref:Uncharacterized protein n=1 Tax=Fusarium sarcochroum TaxID=1208366 RepID=A0A8H4TVE7_9HYPO|nr:hypothetical protein FSARC_7383 [Fusarium sarcochroum]
MEFFERRRRIDEEKRQKFLGTAAVKPRTIDSLARFYNEDAASDTLSWHQTPATIDSDEAKRDIIDEYLCERQSSDGELFYRLSLHWETYKADPDPPDNKWLDILAHRSNSKAIQARRLLNTNNPYTAAFGRFHSIPSMFWGMQLGLIGQMISMPGRDELLHYLMRIDKFWTQVCSNSAVKGKVDAATLELLDCQAPGADQTHYQNLKKALDDDRLLKNLETVDRKLVWTRIVESTRDRCIPTFHAFFRNLGYLSAVSYSMERLKDLRKPMNDDGLDEVHGKRKRKRQKQRKITQNSTKKKSLRQELAKGFQTDHSVEAEYIDQYELGYRTLWAFCLRWHPMLPRGCTSEYQVLRDTYHEHPQVLTHFAHLAHRIGFRSPTIDNILQKTAAVAAIGTQEVQGSQRKAQASRDLEELNASGKPCAAAVAKMRHMLFLPLFHRAVAGQLEFSPFFVQRSLYLDIFGCENAHGLEHLLASDLDGTDYTIPDIADGISRDDDAELHHERLLTEARETVCQLEGEIERIQAEHSTCRVLRSQHAELLARLKKIEAENTELAERSQACLMQAQEAERSRSEAYQQLKAKERDRQELELERKALQQKLEDRAKHTQRPQASTFPGVAGFLRACSQQEDEDPSFETSLVENQLDGLYLQRENTMTWRSSVRTSRVSESTESYPEDQSSRYSQDSILSPGTASGKRQFQIETILPDGGCDRRMIYVNEKELLELISRHQKQDYKLFDRWDGVLTAWAVFDLPQDERTLVLKPYFVVNNA